jgi:glutamine cyclotransferase
LVIHRQGLFFHEGQLYEGTGLYGKSVLRILDTTSGNVLKEHQMASEYFGSPVVYSWLVCSPLLLGEGITLVGSKLFQASLKL